MVPRHIEVEVIFQHPHENSKGTIDKFPVLSISRYKTVISLLYSYSAGFGAYQRVLSPFYSVTTSGPTEKFREQALEKLLSPSIAIWIVIYRMGDGPATYPAVDLEVEGILSLFLASTVIIFWCLTPSTTLSCPNIGSITPETLFWADFRGPTLSRNPLSRSWADLITLEVFWPGLNTSTTRVHLCICPKERGGTRGARWKDSGCESGGLIGGQERGNCI